MGVLIAHRYGDLAGAQVGGTQQFPRLFHSLCRQIFHEGLSHLLAEHRRQVVGADVDLLGYPIQGNIFILKIGIDVSDCTLQKIVVLAAGGLVTQFHSPQKNLGYVAFQIVLCYILPHHIQTAQCF